MQTGVTSVERARVIPYEGKERTSAERGLNMFLAACSGEIARGDVGEKLKLHYIATEAMRPMGAAVGAGDDEDRAMDAVLDATILFNWKCANHNGMAISEDKQWLLLANSVPFRALRAGDFSPPATPSEDASQCGLTGSAGRFGLIDHRDGEYVGGEYSRGTRGGGGKPDLD